jgi:hypothetical protein
MEIFFFLGVLFIDGSQGVEERGGPKEQTKRIRISM